MSRTLRFLLFLACACLVVLAKAQNRDTILLDFGTTASAAPYNNITDARSVAPVDLANADNAPTGYSLVITDIFNGVNTGGTTAPAAGLDLATTATNDSFFGNTAAFNGATEPTGAFELRRLNPSLTYALTFFASRTGATDVREAKYVVRGITSDSASLDASNNTDRTVTLSLKPAADSTITVAVSPGPNNDNASGFYYLGAVRMTYDKQEVPVVVTTPADTFLVDFGTVLSPAPWNNVTDARKDTLLALTDEEGRTTGVTLRVFDAFNGVNTAGTQSPAPGIGLPATATGDSFFGNTTAFGGAVEPTGGVELAGLDPNLEYSVRLFGSRTATDNREARYVVTGATVDSTFVDGASNADRIGEVSLKPTSAGTIRVVASAGPRNTNSSKFYYLGAMTVSTDPTQAQLDSVLVDFGAVASQSPVPWNNITDPANGAVADAISVRGFATGYGVAVVDSFNNVNTAGTANVDPALGIHPAAAGDSFFGNTAAFGGQVQPTGGVALTGLDTAIEYSVSMFASRTATDNREVRFVFRGATADSAFVDAAGNRDKVATVRLKPDARGRILITASAGPENETSQQFYYLNALVLTYPQQTPTGPRELTLVDPNGGETLQVGKTFDIRWESRNVKRVAMAYSVDSGRTYTPIDTVDALLRRYAWTIPANPSTRALVRISEGAVADTSETVFAITSDTTTCTIVVIGSSTAEGTGANPRDSSWVSRFRESITGDNTRYRVINIARGGYTTFHILPSGATRGSGVGIAPDTARNITAALKERPYAVIVNMPSNDAARFFSVATQLRNFEIIDSVGRAGGARVFVTTTQPRNFTNEAQINNQRAVRDSIFVRYGERAIDFWAPLARPDGFIVDSLDSGDGIHVNNTGHRLLFERVRAKRLDTMSCAPLLIGVREQTERAGRYGVKVYPNPMQGERVYLDLGTFASRGEVEVTWVDVLGRGLSAKRAYPAQGGGVLSLERPTGTAGQQVVYCRIAEVSSGRAVVVPVVTE